MAKTNFLQKVSASFKNTGLKASSIAARSFFEDQIKRLGAPGRGEILRTATKKKGTVTLGKMYLFRYDPKFKRTLPFYDRFPLVFVIKGGKNSFLAINLHYLPPNLRIALLNKLMQLSTSKTLNTRSKLKISYDILRTAARFKAFKPTLKRYLGSHVQSAFAEIPGDAWHLTALLPLADFRKAGPSTVWADSRSKF